MRSHSVTCLESILPGLHGAALDVETGAHRQTDAVAAGRAELAILGARLAVARTGPSRLDGLVSDRLISLKKISERKRTCVSFVNQDNTSHSIRPRLFPFFWVLTNHHLFILPETAR